MSKLNRGLLICLSRLGLSITLSLTLLIGLLLIMNGAPKTPQAHAANFMDEAHPRLAQSHDRRRQTSIAQVIQEAAISPQTPATAANPIPTEGAYLGAYIGDLPGNYDQALAEIQEFEQMTGRRLAIVHRYWGMTISATSQYADFDWLHLDQHFSDGRMMMISWNPVNSTTGLTITYQEIISGKYDYVIRPAAQDAAKFGKPLFIRWSWEMDGDWYAHSGPNAFGPDGTQSWNLVDDRDKYFGDPTKADGPERFVAAWRHIRAIFVEAGAKNVIWVWSPNWLSSPIPTPGLITTTWNTLTAYYPGDDQVDWIGTSIYYRGDNRHEWLTFPEMFDHQRGSGDSIAKFVQQHKKPVMIAEIGAAEKDDDNLAKARWITNTYAIDVKAFSWIKAILWFSVKKEEDNGNVIPYFCAK